MNTGTLEQSIVKTLSYFDLTDFPLTAEELFTFLWQPPSITYSVFLEYLTATTATRWETSGGYYFLSGRSEIIAARQRHSVPTEIMLKKARRAVRCISWLPFLKAVLVCNSVGAETATRESDIDLLIITTEHRLWLVRFLSHTILRLLGLRTYGRHTAGRMCLSFFVDEAHLNLGGLRALPEDIHFAFWLQQMFPIYDALDYAARFRSANAWVNQYLPNTLGEHHFLPTYTRQQFPGKLNKFFKSIFEKMWGTAYGNLIEKEARKVQERSLPNRIKELARAQDNNVVIAEGILKLHEHDARARYYQKWLDRIAATL